MPKYLDKQYDRLTLIADQSLQGAQSDSDRQFEAGYNAALAHLVGFLAVMPKEGRSVTARKLVKRFLASHLTPTEAP
jgi:hypothetical protein